MMKIAIAVLLAVEVMLPSLMINNIRHDYGGRKVDDLNDEDSNSSTTGSRSYVTFFDDHHFDDDTRGRQQQQRSHCWISIHNHDNTTTAALRLLGCGSDGFVFKATMTCHHHHDAAAAAAASVSAYNIETTFYDVVIKVNTAAATVTPQKPNSKTHHEHEQQYVRFANMTQQIDPMKDIYKTLLLASRKTTRETLRNHFIVPFGTADIPIQSIYNKDTQQQMKRKQQQPSCRRVLLLPKQQRTTKVITVSIMEESKGTALEKFLNNKNHKMTPRLPTTTVGPSKKSTNSTTTAPSNQIQLQIQQRRRKHYVQRILQNLVCMYQHMFEAKFVHLDVRFRHILISNNNNNDIGGGGGHDDDNHKNIPTVSLIDYDKYTILKDGGKFVNDKYARYNQNLQRLQFFQLLSILSSICYHDMMKKKSFSKKPPPFRRIEKMKPNQNFVLWMNIMEQCIDNNNAGSNNTNATTAALLLPSTRKLSSLLKELLFHSPADDNITSSSQNIRDAYKILLQWTNDYYIDVDSDGLSRNNQYRTTCFSY